MGETETVQVVDRLFAEVWGDPNAKVPDDLIHDDFWSTEPGAQISLDGTTLHPQITGAEALRRELAFYRDFYPDFTLVIGEIMPAHATLRRDVAVFEADRFRGDVVVVTWDSGATHPTATFEDRGGHPRPLQISDKGVSVVRVVDGKIFAANKYWDARSQTLAMMKSD
jgi:hypothetical protein